MSYRSIAVFALTAVVGCGMVFLAGCGEKNEAPEITSLTATPNDSVVVPEAKVVFKVAATDADGDSLTFEWLASGGTITATQPESVVWTAPAAAQVCTVGVKCSDGDKTAEANKVIRARAWSHANASAFTPDSTYLPNMGTTEIPFTWDPSDSLRAGARVESLEITIDVDDADTLELENFLVYLVSPQGTQVLLYDGGELGALDLSLFDVYGFEGEPANGTWKLVFIRDNPQGYNGVVYDCDLDLLYQY